MEQVRLEHGRHLRSQGESARGISAGNDVLYLLTRLCSVLHCDLFWPRTLS